MKFAFSVVLALGSIASYSDAFSSPVTKWRPGKSLSTTKSIMNMDTSENESFMDALSPGKKDDEEKENEVDDSGSTRFQEMMKSAQQTEGTEIQRQPTPIMNPFINPISSTRPQTQPTANPDDLSVEDQARMFREIMAGKQQNSPSTDIALESRPQTSRPTRPVGRNRDADMIANSSDLYFAQLKRDSTIRTIGRIRGEKDISEAVFEDEGIEQLQSLVQENPYLKSQKDDEMTMYQSLPDDLLKPYFENSDLNEKQKSQSGINYKEKMMERRQKKLQGGTVSAIPLPSKPPKQDVVENTVDVIPTPSPLLAPPVIEKKVTTPPYSLQQQQPPLTTEETKESIFAPTNPEKIKQKIRTLMGLTLKHRGGPGFGKGRLKGQEIDRFEGLLEEITNLLREESKLAQTVDKPLISATEPVMSPPSALEPIPVEAAGISVETMNIDTTIACIEGAITMYTNSPPAIQKSVLVTLRAALESAVDTCNIILASQPPPSIEGSPDSRIEGMIACIDGAITMYKNSPPQLKNSVLTVLRAALISSVETCNFVLGQDQVPPHPPPVASTVNVSPAQITTSSAPVSQLPQATAADLNSKALEHIYEKVKAASGDGNLGLRNDLTAAEATELADQLVDMRGILMEELDSGIPDPQPVDTTGQESSASSRYQEMLSKARAKKAKG
mmetsp:Transcript_37886/g.42436  ORF Transcript_37886/g.42436 Transcript_37886/m.42436 type:complete len:673 (+) Transcript_37886:87-2105(+)